MSEPEYDNPLGTALAKLPSHLQVAEFLRLAVRDDLVAREAVHQAMMRRQIRLSGDITLIETVFHLFLAGR